MDIPKARRRALRRTIAIAMIGAGWSCGAAAAAPTARQQTAYDASQIPAGWTAMAPAGTCVANPWSSGCPPVKSITFPSDATLSATALSQRGLGPAPAPVATTTSTGLSLGSQARDHADPSAFPLASLAQAAVAPGDCTLAVYAPSILTTNGNHYASATDVIHECNVRVAYAEVTADLFRSGVLEATDWNSSSAPGIFAAASAHYDCDHPNSARPYTNVGLGYIVGVDGTAAANTGSVTRNHNCPS